MSRTRPAGLMRVRRLPSRVRGLQLQDGRLTSAHVRDAGVSKSV